MRAQMSFRECACGCDREVPLPLTGVNADAQIIQVELMEWDGLRHMTRSLSNYSDGPVADNGQLDPFIDAGAAHYQAILDALHETRPFMAGPLDTKGIKHWIKFSRKSRKKMGRSSGVIRTDKTLSVRPEDADRLDRWHPELSFTGPDPDGRKLAEEAGLLDHGEQNA